MYEHERINEMRKHFPYAGFHGCESWCNLQITGSAKLALVVMEEADDNPGTSITNRSEKIASQIVSTFDMHPHRCIFVEHYLPHPHRVLAEYKIVTYSWHVGDASTPEWTEITNTQFQALRELVEQPGKEA